MRAASWIDRHVGLGHRRLAVIDLAGGVQPSAGRGIGTDNRPPSSTPAKSTTSWSLREELKQLGHQFKTRSDTEVRAPRILAMGRGGCRTSQRYVRFRNLGRSNRRAVS